MLFIRKTYGLVSRCLSILSYSAMAIRRSFVQIAECGEIRVFHRRAVENSQKLWKTQNASQLHGGKLRCKAEVTHTFHRRTVENPKIAKVQFSAFCLLDSGFFEKSGRNPSEKAKNRKKTSKRTTESLSQQKRASIFFQTEALRQFFFVNTDG